MLEIKYFVSLKNESFLFWTRVHFKGGGGVKFSKILRGFLIKGGLTDLEFFWWGEGHRGKKGWADTLVDTMSVKNRGVGSFLLN